LFLIFDAIQQKKVTAEEVAAVFAMQTGDGRKHGELAAKEVSCCSLGISLSL
jgi:hypothetical protein